MVMPMLEKRLLYLLASAPLTVVTVVLGTLHGSVHLIVAGIGWGAFNFGFIFGSYVERFFVAEDFEEGPEPEQLLEETVLEKEAAEEENNAEPELAAAAETEPPEEEKRSD